MPKVKGELDVKLMTYKGIPIPFRLDSGCEVDGTFHFQNYGDI